MSKIRQNKRKITESIRNLMLGQSKFKTARKDSTEFVKRMVKLHNRLIANDSRVLWDSSSKGTYIKSKHGEL